MSNQDSESDTTDDTEASELTQTFQVHNVLKSVSGDTFLSKT